MLDLRGNYVDAICKEMALRPSSNISTVYIGGGTPSQLSPFELNRIFTHIDKVYEPSWKEIEVTLECNPDDITDSFCENLKSLPVNRVSMGLQTFNDNRLEFLHRRHKANDIQNAIDLLHKAGIDNISIDLMFGFPDESLEDVDNDVSRAIELNVKHMSAYSLQYEEGTILNKMLEDGKIKDIDDELYRTMFNLICDRLISSGYEHYEISNFARPGFRSKHNSSYWHGVPYIGIGASAHSYSGKTRSWNISNLQKYIDSINKGVLPSESEIIDSNTRYDDMILTALRTKEGINLNDLTSDHKEYLMKSAERYIKDNELEISGDYLSLTRKGIYISDMIMSDLMIG